MAYQPLGPRMLGKKTGLNMNSTGDQAVAIDLPAGYTRYVISRIIVTNASLSLTLAAGGIYTAAAKSGTAVVAAAQVYSALTSAAAVLLAALANTNVRTEATLYFALTTAQGAAATADIFVIGDVIE